MAKKPKIAELEGVASNAEVISELEPETVSDTVVDEIENFKLYLANMTAELLSTYKAAIDDEVGKRRRIEIDKVSTFFKGLSSEEQQIFLDSIRATTASKQNLVNVAGKKPKKEKNPLRMYQNYPNDENPQFKVAPIVNLELKEIFTGGNPRNKSWLANLQLEERYELFGTMKKLEQNSEFIYELMNIPKAVFKKEAENWIDCCKE